MISAFWRGEVHEVARRAYRKANGDREAAKTLAQDNLKKLGINPILLSLLVQLAIYLINKWADSFEVDPPSFDPHNIDENEPQ